MNQLDTPTVALGEIEASHFRDFLGPISHIDVLALKEDSLDRWNDFWTSLRVYRHEDKLHLLFGHRRVRAAMLKWGKQAQRKVQVVEVTDEEKILFLGEAGWKNATDEERIGLVKLASAFLTEYGEGYTGQVDIHLLKERTENGRSYEGSTRISNWLGKRLWPQQRISDLLKPSKSAKHQENAQESIQEQKQAENQTAVQPIEAAGTESQGVSKAGEDTPVTEIERAEHDLNAIISGASSFAEKPSKKAPVQLLPRQALEKLLTTRKNGIANDLEKRVDRELKRIYRDDLLNFLQGVNV